MSDKIRCYMKPSSGRGSIHVVETGGNPALGRTLCGKLAYQWEALPESDWHNSAWLQCSVCTGLLFAEQISGKPKTTTHPWKLVSAEPPQMGVWVLGYNQVGFFEVVRLATKRGGIRWERPYTTSAYYEHITHWRPLPNPPVKQEEPDAAP